MNENNFNAKLEFEKKIVQISERIILFGISANKSPPMAPKTCCAKSQVHDIISINRMISRVSIPQGLVQ